MAVRKQAQRDKQPKGCELEQSEHREWSDHEWQSSRASNNKLEGRGAGGGGRGVVKHMIRDLI